ncbi:MAG: hypothetical protein L3J32_08635 [Rhizobiaceae bacterium]|nr:hypothetical protein [Rhizobiaceae bacterium]
MLKHLCVSLVIATGIAAPSIFQPTPVFAQQMPGMPGFEHIVLSEKIAKQAIDATLFIRKNYKDNEIASADPSNMVGVMKSRGIYNKILGDLRAFGFNSPEEWSKAAMSTAIAVGFLENGDGQDMMAQMRELQKDKSMSAEMKAQMLATMQAIMPPENNMAVVKKILKDRAYSSKVKKLFEG